MDNKNNTCNICNKKYKTSQSLWNHKNKFHPKNDHKMTNEEPQNDHCMTNNEELKIKEKIKITDKTICEYCNKKLSAYTHLRRHLKTCKIKQTQILENEILKKEHEEMKKEHEEMKKAFDELKNIMLETMNKNKIVD